MSYALQFVLRHKLKVEGRQFLVSYAKDCLWRTSTSIGHMPWCQKSLWILLTHLQQRHDWGVWRTVVSLVLLWHHEGLLLSLGVEAPVCSLECALSQQADKALVRGAAGGGVRGQCAGG
jgi:hypothetical protein